MPVLLSTCIWLNLHRKIINYWFISSNVAGSHGTLVMGGGAPARRAHEEDVTPELGVSGKAPGRTHLSAKSQAFASGQSWEKGRQAEEAACAKAQTEKVLLRGNCEAIQYGQTIARGQEVSQK